MNWLRGSLLAALLLLSGSAAPGDGRPAIVPLDAHGYNDLIARHRGQPLLVNFWATWCAPCMEEFPDLLKLKRRYESRGLIVEFVSIDRPQDAATTVAAFLRRQKVEFTTYIKKAGSDEEFITAVHPDWSGALPATVILDAEGTVRHLLIDRQTVERLSALVEPLVKH